MPARAPAERGANSLPTRSAGRRYAFAVAVVVAAWAARTALTPHVGPTALPFISFFPAVAFAGWYGGLWPALLTTALSALAADWFFSEPLHSLHLRDPVAFLAFGVAAGCIVAAIEAMHRAEKRVTVEIAGRENACADLESSRDLLATTLASIGDGVAVTDVEGRVTFLNPEAERLTGWSGAEARGQPLSSVFRIVNEDTRAPVENPAEKVRRLGTVVGLANHTLLLAKDGRETPIDDSAAPVRHDGGPMQGVVLVFRDFTERRRAGQAQARLVAIVESSGDAIVSKDLDGTVRTWNAGAERLFGWRPEEIVGQSVKVLIPPDLLDEETLILDRIRSGRQAEFLETVRVAKDGRRIPVSVTVSPVLDRDGRVVGASKIVRDISEIVASREALAQEKDLLATTLSSIGDAVIVTDAAGLVTFLNPVAESLTGWPLADARGTCLPRVFQVLNETTREEVENPALRAVREGVVVGLANHSILVSRSGEERPVDDIAAPIRDTRGSVVGSVLVFRDVTQRRRTEDELRTSRDRLRQQADQLMLADRRKNEFLATLAHELRNPLAPIRNSISLLQLLGPADGPMSEARDVIERQVRHMARLLDDLLDVNRLGRGRLELRLEEVALADVVRSAVETARPSIEAGRHELDVDLPAEPVSLPGDAVRLSQVFANLLNNAAKYMDPGGRIRLTARVEAGEAVVRVRDQGIGIAPESMPTLFELFSQAPGALDRAQGGVGIGLYLAKGLVDLHGGRISATSEGVGKGSEFVVRLPGARVAPRAGRGSAPAHTINGVRRRIVVADDLKDNADSLATMLKAMGHEVHAVYDGIAAIAAAEERRPEVVLLDIGMPKLDGYETCRRIRAEPWGRSMYLIAQTGWGQPEDLRLARDAGFDNHMLKPVNSARLAEILATLPRKRV